MFGGGAGKSKWAALKQKVADREDDFAHITKKCDVKSLSGAVNAARNKLKRERLERKKAEKAEMRRRNKEMKARLAAATAGDSKGLSKDINSKRAALTEERRLAEEERARRAKHYLRGDERTEAQRCWRRWWM